MRFALRSNIGNVQLDDQCIDLARACAVAERNAIASILANPSTLLPAAQYRGLDIDYFCEPDFRLMYSACEIAREQGRTAILKYIKRAFLAEGWWDESQIPANAGWTMRHSSESLVAFASMYPESVGAVRLNADTLMRIVRKEQAVKAAIRALQAALNDAMEHARPLLEGRAA